MKIILGAAVTAAMAIATFGSAAQAAKLCRLTGTYTDEYGIATANIKGAKGQLVAPDVCATPYNFKITDETQTGFTVTGGNKTKSCGKFTTTATFENSCSVFSVSGTINGQQYSDVFTKQAKARVAPKADAGLSAGFK